LIGKLHNRCLPPNSGPTKVKKGAAALAAKQPFIGSMGGVPAVFKPYRGLALKLSPS
jgi:hypothetical protein